MREPSQLHGFCAIRERTEKSRELSDQRPKAPKKTYFALFKPREFWDNISQVRQSAISTMIKTFAFALSMASSGVILAGEQPPVPVSPAAASVPAAATPETGGGPKIALATNVYDFGRVSAGDPVKYTFVFTNIGNQLLEVTQVQPQCGCTAAGDWTHKVEPGHTGAIPLQFNTANYNGPVSKNITVTCNDKSQSTLILQLKGTVWKPVEVNPQFAVMNIPPDSPSGASTTVRIVNHLDEPLILAQPESSNKAFEAELRTNAPGKEYEVVVKVMPPLSPGNVQAQISLKTSSQKVPTVNFTAWANVQAAVTIVPIQVSIPAAPLSSKVTSAITIQGNSTNALTLTEPMVNAKDVEVQIKELQPGRSYSAILTFPQGFEVTPGQPVQFSVKSSNPQFPVIKVPIIQLPKQASPVVPVKAANSAAAR